MTKTQFRCVLIAYLLFHIAKFTGKRLVHYTKESIVPEAVRQVEPVGTQAVTLALWIPLLLLSVGMIGMFFFWRPSRYFFLSGLVFMVAFWLVDTPWYTVTAFDGACGYLGHVLQGGILALAFVGPAKAFFQKEASINSLQPTREDARG